MVELVLECTNSFVLFKNEGGQNELYTVQTHENEKRYSFVFDFKVWFQIVDLNLYNKFI